MKATILAGATALALSAALVAERPAQAAPIAYGATLSGAAELPPNNAPGTGSTTVTLDTAAHLLTVDVTFSGLSAGTTMAHIHCCVAPPGNAGVATQTPTFVNFPLGVTAGTYAMTFDTTQAATWNAPFIAANGGTPLGAEAALAAGLAAGQAYLNIHTTAFMAGEIRGFLQPVPEPATLALLAAGVVTLAGVRGRRGGRCRTALRAAA